jgi:hypothetical protein
MNPTRNVRSLVDELCATSREFAAMWRDNDVQGHGDGAKVLHHPIAGPLAMDFSAFAVWPARPQHGDLQSCNARGCGQDPRAAEVSAEVGATRPDSLSATVTKIPPLHRSN